MSIFNEGGTFSNKNFISVAKMVETGNLQPQLVEDAVRHELDKNRLKYQYPASVAAAQVHRQASKFGYNKTYQGEPPRLCPCCMERVETEDIGLCYPTTDIGIAEELGYEQYQLSSGISLYFSFLKMALTYLAFRFLISDGFNLITNIVFGKHCQSEDQELCSHNIWNQASIVNIKDR